MRSKRDIILAILIFALGFTMSELRSAVIHSMTPDDLPSPSDRITEDEKQRKILFVEMAKGGVDKNETRR